ncbi:MAG: ornithine cyclodeaminase family protein, partial [Acidobacteria bacterium]|nr:ornithine cyclodeaminase family protein [Acidobacteriota bacterium]
CGRQGRIQLVALKHALPLEQAYVFDSSWEAACRCAKEMSEVLQFPVIPVRDLAAAVRHSEVCVTCTPSRAAVLHAGELPAGIFVSAVGADSPDKQELDPALLAASTVVVDVLEQCAAAGELHHAVAAGLMQPSDVYAELGEIVAGVKPGRRDPDETIIFDATGTALQDVASAAAAYRKAVERNVGTWMALAE